MSAVPVANEKNPNEIVSKKTLFHVISASSVGTMIEWYDFYIFGSLSTVLASKFYQTGTPLGDILSLIHI